ncbi:hypothetical protein AA11825_1195 [Acetobacter pomorum DSM 11825]|nr:hypothetical protein AA11825_1195 [Acetobacter pomorum DSM 11825]
MGMKQNSLLNRKQVFKWNQAWKVLPKWCYLPHQGPAWLRAMAWVRGVEQVLQTLWQMFAVHTQPVQAAPRPQQAEPPPA